MICFREQALILTQSGGVVPCGDGVPSVEKSPISQRFQPFLEKNRCVCLFSKSGYEEINLPRGDKGLIVKKYLLA